MMQETGCAGVVVGRGCLGRPWLFAELAAAFNGASQPLAPDLSEVSAVIYRHGELLVDFLKVKDVQCATFVNIWRGI